MQGSYSGELTRGKSADGSWVPIPYPLSPTPIFYLKHRRWKLWHPNLGFCVLWGARVIVMVKMCPEVSKAMNQSVGIELAGNLKITSNENYLNTLLICGLCCSTLLLQYTVPFCPLMSHFCHILTSLHQLVSLAESSLCSQRCPPSLRQLHRECLCIIIRVVQTIIRVVQIIIAQIVISMETPMQNGGSTISIWMIIFQFQDDNELPWPN